MKNELSRELGVNQGRSLTTSDAASRKTAIRLALAKLAIRRQANPGKETMDLYAADLVEMNPEDVLSALESLSCRRRAEGETAFPDWATVLEEVNLIGRRRRIAAQKAMEAAEREEWARIREERRKEYVSTQEVWDELTDRLAKKVSMPQ